MCFGMRAGVVEGMCTCVFWHACRCVGRNVHVCVCVCVAFAGHTNKAQAVAVAAVAVEAWRLGPQVRLGAASLAWA